MEEEPQKAQKAQNFVGAEYAEGIPTGYSTPTEDLDRNSANGVKGNTFGSIQRPD